MDISKCLAKRICGNDTLPLSEGFKQRLKNFYYKTKSIAKFLAMLIVFFTTGIANNGLLFAQGKTNIWIHGYDNYAPLPWGATKINFISGYPDTAYTPAIQQSLNASLATICDTSGNLLIYTNGIALYNANYDTLINGDSINPAPFTSLWVDNGMPIVQGYLILPMPGDTDKYYLFHETIDAFLNTDVPKELYYSIIDMSLNGGLGAVISKNNILINDTVNHGKITACKHANGRDWWIIKPDIANGKFYKILLTPYTMIVYSQFIGTIRTGALGQVCFSPDGSKYAFYDFVDKLDVFDFDRCSGMFSNWRHVNINDSADATGVAFSNNSRFLYASSNNYVYQFDTWNQNLDSTRITVAVWDTFFSPQPPFATRFFLAQNASDGKIYINCPNGVLHMHYIERPDSTGLACNVVQHGLALPTFNAYTIPNHPNYFLGPDAGSICDSLTGINENVALKFDFKIYPNPVLNNELTITYLLPQNKNGVFYIYDMVGKKVFSYNLPQWSTMQQLKLHLNKGIYVATITSNHQSVTKKIIVE